MKYSMLFSVLIISIFPRVNAQDIQLVNNEINNISLTSGNNGDNTLKLRTSQNSRFAMLNKEYIAYCLKRNYYNDFLNQKFKSNISLIRLNENKETKHFTPFTFKNDIKYYEISRITITFDLTNLFKQYK